MALARNAQLCGTQRRCQSHLAVNAYELGLGTGNLVLRRFSAHTPARTHRSESRIVNFVPEQIGKVERDLFDSGRRWTSGRK
jgi:hypothetical protein